MNEDRLVDTGRNIAGKAESALGEAMKDTRLEGRGAIDQAAGAIQHGYGKAKDLADDFIDGTPDAIAQGIERGRQWARRSEAALERRLGDNGTWYLLAGAAALVVISLYAAHRRDTASPPARGRQKQAPKKSA